MTRLLAASACALAALLATDVHAQDAPRRCPDGEADSQGISLNVSVQAHPTRVASTLDSLLVAGGWVIQKAPNGAGRWQIEPRFTWQEELLREDAERGPHPGVFLVVETEERADSTHVQASAQAICKAGDESESLVELISVAGVATELISVLDTLKAHGVDVTAAVERSVFQVSYPEAVGEFGLVDREVFPDPRLGTSLRYERADRMYFDVYVYPGVPADSTCPVACAEDRVAAEVEDFTGSFPDLIARGYYRRMDVVSDDAVAVPEGAAWRAGREVVMEVVRGQGPATPMESRFILYSFPGFMVKVRATNPPSTKAAGTVQQFVADLLELLVRK